MWTAEQHRRLDSARRDCGHDRRLHVAPARSLDNLECSALRSRRHGIDVEEERTGPDRIRHRSCAIDSRAGGDGADDELGIRNRSPRIADRFRRWDAGWMPWIKANVVGANMR